MALCLIRSQSRFTSTRSLLSWEMKALLLPMSLIPRSSLLPRLSCPSPITSVRTTSIGVRLPTIFSLQQDLQSARLFSTSSRLLRRLTKSAVQVVFSTRASSSPLTHTCGLRGNLFIFYAFCIYFLFYFLTFFQIKIFYPIKFILIN